jgi:hypothetical protein
MDIRQDSRSDPEHVEYTGYPVSAFDESSWGSHKMLATASRHRVAASSPPASGMAGRGEQTGVRKASNGMSIWPPSVTPAQSLPST